MAHSEPEPASLRSGEKNSTGTFRMARRRAATPGSAMGKDWLERPEKWKRPLTRALRPSAQVMSMRITATIMMTLVWNLEGGGGGGGLAGGELGAADSTGEEAVARADGHGFEFVVARDLIRRRSSGIYHRRFLQWLVHR
ncbi:hypothetical protein MA16_Dca021992 [Dendrobium catenatum]|uniref:Uncharacterized protein n=1 Tax=Dendrobium catenatum TaxID=906689 RepID=A0A2I0X9X8_9ASPA|nr:hypothetical protein MA16_Dca021992 [Dendrobium catenatum]